MLKLLASVVPFIADPLQTTDAVFKYMTWDDSKPRDILPDYVFKTRNPGEMHRGYKSPIITSKSGKQYVQNYNNASVIELGRKLGEGGYGQVWEGKIIHIGNLEPMYYKKFIGKRVAVKIATSPYTTRRETELYKPLLGLKGVIPVFDTFSDEWQFIVQEFLPISLGDYIKQNRVPNAEFMRIASCLIRNLAKIHARGIIHQDIKPENIMFMNVGKIGSCDDIVFIDFGLACHRTEQKTEYNRCWLGGTPLYGPTQTRRGEAGKTPEFRDDLESLAYTLLDSMGVKLPLDNGLKRIFGRVDIEKVLGKKYSKPFVMLLEEARRDSYNIPPYEKIAQAFEQLI